MPKSSATTEEWHNVVITLPTSLLVRIDTELELQNRANPHMRIPRKALLSAMLESRIDIIEADRKGIAKTKRAG